MIRKVSKFINFKNYIYLYVFLLPFTYFAPQLGLLTVIFLIWWLTELKKHKEYLTKLKELFSFRATLFMFLFLSYVCLSYFWSENKEEFKNVLNTHKYFFFIIPLIFASLNKDEAINSLKMLAISFSIYGFFSLLIYLNFISWEDSSSSNPKFLFRYMITGIYLVFGTFLSYYFYTKIITKEKYVYLVMTFISLFGVFINKGKSAQISLLFTIVLLILINVKKINFNYKKILILISFFIIVSVSIINNNKLIDRYSLTFKDIKACYAENICVGTAGYRIMMDKVGIEIFKTSPLIGVGAGDLKDTFHKKVKEEKIKLGWMYNTLHNIYMEYLVKYGLLGFSFFLFSLFYLLWTLRNSEYFHLSIMIISPLSIVFLFDSILVYKPFNNVFIMIFTLLAVLGFYEQKKETEKLQ